LLKRLYPPIKTFIPPYKDVYNKKYNKKYKEDVMSAATDLDKKQTPSKGYITLSDFDEFWNSLYPTHRRGSKGETLTKWEQICRLPTSIRPTMNRIRRALKKQKDSKNWTDEGGKYIPLARTWLHQERWLDDPTQWFNHKELKSDSEQEESHGISWKEQFGFKED